MAVSPGSCCTLRSRFQPRMRQKLVLRACFLVLDGSGLVAVRAAASEDDLGGADREPRGYLRGEQDT